MKKKELKKLKKIHLEYMRTALKTKPRFMPRFIYNFFIIWIYKANIKKVDNEKINLL